MRRGLLFGFNDHDQRRDGDRIEQPGVVRRHEDNGAGISGAFEVLLVVLGQLTEERNVELLLLFRNGADLQLLDDGRRLDGIVDDRQDVGDAGAFGAAFDFELSLLGLLKVHFRISQKDSNP